MREASNRLTTALSLLASQPDAALEAAREAQLFARAEGDALTEALAGRAAGQALRLMGRHEEALEMLARASDVAEEPLLAHQIKIGCIDSLCVLGREVEAIDLANTLRERFTKLKSYTDIAKVWVNMGNIYYRRDEYPQARSCFERALPIFEREGDGLAAGRTQANIANILSLQSETEEAFLHFEKARSAFLAHGAAPQVAMIDSNTGFLRYVSGEHAHALQLMSQARREFAEKGMDVERAKCEADMAEVYRDLSLYPEALERYQSAIDLFSRLSLAYELARAERGLAEALFSAARKDEAFVMLERAERGFTRQGNAVQLAGVLTTKARFLIAQGDAEAAKAAASEARVILRRRRMHGAAGEADCLFHEIGLEEGFSSVQDMRRVVNSALRNRRRWLACRAENAIGDRYARLNAKRLAIRSFRAAAEILEEARTLLPSEEMHIAFLSGKEEIYEDLIRALLERGRKPDVLEALQWAERAKTRFLLDGASPTAASSANEGGDSSPIQRIRAELNRSYYRLYELDDGGGSGVRESAAASLKRVTDLEKRYRAALTEAALIDGSVEPLPNAERQNILMMAQNALESDELLISYFSLQGSLCAFIITPDEASVKMDIAPMDEIDYLSRRLRYQLQRCELMGANRAGELATRGVLQSLYERVFKPVGADAAARKLVIVPHGALHGSPFSAYFDGAAHLLDRFEVLYAPSITHWLSTIGRPVDAIARRKALFIGAPAPGIEEVGSEIEACKRLFPEALALLGEAATTQAFWDEARDSRWLHIACHALFRSDNPLFSALRLADGWVMARDLFHKRLDCELATLSACHTGASSLSSRGEAFGLARGFLSAGARSLCVSLWAANDSAAAQTMIAFYRGVLAEKPFGAALRDAQLEMRERSPHPCHWANFILIGARAAKSC